MNNSRTKLRGDEEFNYESNRIDNGYSRDDNGKRKHSHKNESTYQRKRTKYDEKFEEREVKIFFHDKDSDILSPNPFKENGERHRDSRRKDKSRDFERTRGLKRKRSDSRRRSVSENSSRSIKRNKYSVERDDRKKINVKHRDRYRDRDHENGPHDKRINDSPLRNHGKRRHSREGRDRYKKEINEEQLAEETKEPTQVRRGTRKKQTLGDLLECRSAKERTILDVFRPNQLLRDYCAHITREDCFRNSERKWLRCEKIHYKKIVKAHTDLTVGNCSYLNNCFNVNTCKYVHYEIEPWELVESDFAVPPARLELPSLPSPMETTLAEMSGNSMPGEVRIKYPPQWLQCDLRVLDLSILGKFAVIMADPPWDIHMGLPYGTMADDEMRNLKIPLLQDDGYIFLWVTGRAMELGRECLKLWGYRQVDEIVWLKTNQVQSLVRSGRTGHWLNHTKEHCIVGVKGDPKGFNTGVDCDVIVSEVRDTSHKPDEIYDIIERLSPGTRKIELFGRPHNLRNNWVTLGNQLNGSFLSEPPVIRRFMAACAPSSAQSNSVINDGLN